MMAMPALTRSPYHPREECWEIYYGDVHAGTITERTGNPHDTEPWKCRRRLLSRLAPWGMHQRHRANI